MADFATWAQPTLAKLAADQQAEAVRLRAIIADLCRVIESLCSNDCKKPERIPAYLNAMDAIK
jgi:hypothetical protein